jgi:uncharacterized protein (TIGR00369 family)
MDADELNAFFRREFPQAAAHGFEVLSVGPDGVALGLDPRDVHLRPGGTVSGPTLMTLADTAMYASLLAKLGPGVATAVTSGLEIHFLHRPRPVRLLITATLLKVGRRLAVGTVDFVDEDRTRVAHATVTYALPERPAG